ncbi:unnamed protein product [Prunus armeniaca]|uniref:Uncharacterized protein n=1 Tax=Prunus armeniaca TaxID=36596 RepID=A0A6J5UJ41_PRUAR|nr:unnamed protein product [Prunus armeniaca]
MFSPLPLLFCRLLLGWLWLVAVAGGRGGWLYLVVGDAAWSVIGCGRLGVVASCLGRRDC